MNKNIRNKLMKYSIRLIAKLKISTTGWILNVPTIHKMMHQLIFLKSKKIFIENFYFLIFIFKELLKLPRTNDLIRILVKLINMKIIHTKRLLK